MNKPNINVTPLIDVLLVLLIIFMVVSPLKPSAFKARLPSEPKNEGETNADTLVIRVANDGSLNLNNESGLGSVDDTSALVKRLSDIFHARNENLAFRQDRAADAHFVTPDQIDRTVFIKAPPAIGYGDVAKVIDAAKIAGSVPISLQLDDLD